MSRSDGDGTASVNGIRGLTAQNFQIFPDYRLYCTPEYWVVTYKDQDFIRIMRNTSHRPGFSLLMLELIYALCRGVRTDARDRWAIYQQAYDSDAKDLGLECLASSRKVIEFSYELLKPNIRKTKE